MNIKKVLLFSCVISIYNETIAAEGDRINVRAQEAERRKAEVEKLLLKAEKNKECLRMRALVKEAREALKLAQRQGVESLIKAQEAELGKAKEALEVSILLKEYGSPWYAWCCSVLVNNIIDREDPKDFGDIGESLENARLLLKTYPVDRICSPESKYGTSLSTCLHTLIQFRRNDAPKFLALFSQEEIKSVRGLMDVARSRDYFSPDTIHYLNSIEYGPFESKKRDLKS